LDELKSTTKINQHNLCLSWNLKQSPAQALMRTTFSLLPPLG
jgi:hypothetical protein